MVGDEAESTEDAPAVAPTGTARPRTKWRAAVVVVLLIAVAVAGYVWLTHAHVLQEFGNEWGSEIGPGHTLYADAAIYPASGGAARIDIRTIRPRVTLNTADATIDVLSCTAAVGATRIGAVVDDLDAYCASASPWRPGAATIGSQADAYFLLAITPRRDGRVTVDGADVTYRSGIRSGTQHAGIAAVLTTP